MKTLMPQLRERKGTIFKRRLAVQICAVLLATLMLIPILPPNQQVLADPLPVTQVFDLSDSSDPSILKKIYNAAQSCSLLATIMSINIFTRCN